MVIIRTCLWIGLFLAFVFCTFGLGECFRSVDELEKIVKSQEQQVKVLKLKLDAQELALSEEMAKNEDLKYKLMNLQNAYVRVKRDNEQIAHRMARGESNESSN